MAKNDESNNGFSDAEKEAMKERTKELKRQKTAKGKADGEEAVLEKINEMEGEDKKIASGLHALIKENFPQLGFKTWYGYPAYTKDEKLITFFQASTRFKTRYSTLGFSEDARLDEGTFWPTSYAVLEWNDKVAAEINKLIKKAIE
ncbi:MAG: hypothetical protein AAGU15_10265 [Anaerolineaceae bacterium]